MFIGIGSPITLGLGPLIEITLPFDDLTLGGLDEGLAKDGNTLSLTVNNLAGGATIDSYGWQASNGNVPGATASTYVVDIDALAGAASIRPFVVINGETYLGPSAQLELRVPVLNGLITVGDYANSALLTDPGSITVVPDYLDDVRWGTSLNGSQLGTGTSPSDFNGLDSGDPDNPTIVYWRGTDAQSNTYNFNFPVRAAKIPFTSQPTLTRSNDEVTLDEGTAAGVIELVSFTLDGQDVSSSLVNNVIDVSNLTGTLQAVLRTVSSGGYVTSTVNLALVAASSWQINQLLRGATIVSTGSTTPNTVQNLTFTPVLRGATVSFEET